MSVDPWPGRSHPDNIGALSNWWSDDPDPDKFEEDHMGAKIIYQWREEFMSGLGHEWLSA